jgi:hypothetical protein
MLQPGKWDSYKHIFYYCFDKHWTVIKELHE